MSGPRQLEAPSGTSYPRATGASLAVIVLVLVCFAVVMALHVVRRDIDPLQDVMSGYANGSHGLLMTIAFYATGLAALALGFRLRPAIHGHPAARAVPPALALSGLSLLVSGVFEVGLPGAPESMEETVHSAASVSAFVLVVAAMLLLSFACGRDPRWRSFGVTSWVLAGAAGLAAMASPLVDGTRSSGIIQRVLGVTVLLWLLLTALRIRSNALRPNR